MTWSKVGITAPPTVDVSAVARATMSATAVTFASSSTVPVPDETTISRSWLGSSVVPEALKTSYARPDSYSGALSSWTAFSASVPPAARLRTKIPIVATNHNAMTGQRWAALKDATRTVQGGRRVRAGAIGEA